MAAAYYEDIVQLNQTTVRCILCNIHVQDNGDIINSHLIGNKHKDRYYRRLKIRNNIIFKEHHHYCLICRVPIYSSIPDNIAIVRSHIEHNQHISNMERINDLLHEEFIDLPVNITPHGSQAHCTICNRYIDFTYAAINHHTYEPTHLGVRSIAVQPLHGIFSVEGNDDVLWCKICDEYIDNYVEDILDHVYDNDNHSRRFDEIERAMGEDISIEEFLTNVNEYKAFCNECHVWVPCNPYNLKQHTKGGRHTS